MNSKLKLTDYLAKWQKYLKKGLNQSITQDNWEYFKANGELPPLPNELKLFKQLLAGWNYNLMFQDFKDGLLTEDELNEFVTTGVITLDTLKKLNKELEQTLYDYGFGDEPDEPYEKFEKLLDWCEAKLEELDKES